MFWDDASVCGTTDCHCLILSPPTRWTMAFEIEIAGAEQGVLYLVNTEAETSACVAFGDRRVLAPLGRIRHARANITPAHIWRPGKAKRLSERTFIDVFESAQFLNTEARANSMRAHIWRPERTQRLFELTFTNAS